ncbi:MAG: hypothetical protein O2901_14055 [Verrucomicrobia bacterium]|nr:hypothetical protein [Verrucomicrobiota bacterium]
MRIFQRILIVLLLLLGAGSLAVGLKLFSQREILKARIQRLEGFVKSMAPTIESEPSEIRDQPGFTSLQGMGEDYADPDYTFWNKYIEVGGAGLEATDAATFRVDPEILKNLYRRDPVEPAKPFKDAEGRKIMEGEGTMDLLLDGLQEKTRAQLDRLNDTRYWLTQMRTELDATILKHNKVMDQRNERRVEVAELKEERAQLQAELRTTKASLAEAREQIDTLEADIRDKEEEYEQLNIEFEDLKVDMAALEKQHDDLRIQCGLVDPDDETEDPDGQEPTRRGEKGRIAYHDSENHFVIFSVPADTDLKDGVELTCVGKDSDDLATPTGKLRFRELFSESNQAVADVLNDWEIRKDDRVIF